MALTTGWRSGAASDPGLLRSQNEDRIWVDDTSGVFLVVDGMGGRAAGDVAAGAAVEVIAGQPTNFDGDAEDRVRQAIAAANNEIHRRAGEREEWHGMACVLTLAVAHGDQITLGHVGDSRLYLAWNGTLRKLTADHSPVGELEDEGKLTEAAAMAHPRRNEVFRDVGSRPRDPHEDEFIQVKSFPFRPGAALLLCTDGLSDMLTSAEISAIIGRYSGDAASVAEELVAAANELGGKDNISVIFVAGPEFAGSQSGSPARAGHAITQVRQPESRWRKWTTRLVAVFRRGR